ncbi:uncharacterized protein LOC107798493 [Nicotiana tabacum]|uniref:uncharacterized protein LOC107798493 n=1 Tax=Nicotiana tabacum TaxID=4097 RepID=UPI003F4EA79E
MRLEDMKIKVGDAFTTYGFRGWNKGLERLKSHVGDVNSVHNRCFKMMLDLMNQAQSILTSLDKQSEKIKSKHRVRLNASIDVIRYLLKEGMPFRGHDESVTSTRREETAKAIIEDLNGNFFGILVDESKDVSHKEQMALVLRYVNKEGELIERFLGLVHVKDTTGYDGASNMQEEINSLKALIMKDNPSAYCVHCFAHQLQLTLVAVEKKHHNINIFFDILANVLNVVGGSYKRREMLRDDQAEKLDELLVLGEVHTGSGLNQELGLQIPDDTRWRSHFKTLRNFISLFSSIVHVLGVLTNEGSNYQEKALAKSLVEDIRSYEFVYILHLMLKIIAITYDLNMALQRKDQDIVSTMKLVHFTKRQLQTMRESKWNSLLEDVSSFCDKNSIMIPKMDDNHFSEVNTDLLLGIELDNYIDYVREMDNAFSNLKGLGDLSKTLLLEMENKAATFAQ